jgi:colanic acid biosynthesis glycosyl transferase WcaI
MHVLIVSQYFWPENFRINDVALELTKRGHRVIVLTGFPNYPDGKVFRKFLENRQSYSDYFGVSIVRVPLIPRSAGPLRLVLNYISFALSASLFGAVKLRRIKFDVIIAYQPSPITVGLPAVVMRFLKRAPLIFWVQDLWPETLKALGVVRSPLLIWLIGRLVAFIYKRSDLILGQSKGFIKSIRLHAPKEIPVLYFPNWSDSMCDVSGEIDVGKLSRGDNFKVIFTGNIGEAQDFPAILSAAEYLRGHCNIKWFIVGKGRLEAWLSEEIRRRNLQEQVFMLGHYPPEMLGSFYRHADALLLSLKDDPVFSLTIPSKLQTYLAVGLPILAMINGETAKVIVKSKAGLVCNSGDHINLAQHVLKLSLMEISERKKMGGNGMSYSQKNYDKKHLMDRMENWMIHMQTLPKKSFR